MTAIASTMFYVLSVLGINVAFEQWPHLNWLWSIGVGSIFVSRDFCQRSLGHWVGLPMIAGLVLTYFLASPFVALASASAFVVSEGADWLVFTITKRSLADRVLLSCGISAPLKRGGNGRTWGALIPEIGFKPREQLDATAPTVRFFDSAPMPICQSCDAG